MATYGVSFYGSGVLYGEDVGLDFHAANFVAKPVDATGSGAFETLRVSWLAPDGAWDTLRLVRKHSGFPVDHNDGLRLFDDDVSVARAAFVDTMSAGDRVAYYSLFVFASVEQEWVRVGDAWAVVVADYGYADILYRFLPNSVVESDYTISSYLPDPQKNPLYRLMETVGFELSHIRTELELLRRAYNPDTLPAPALVALGETFGVTYEPELGLYNTRVATRNAAYIAKHKGTAPGVEAMASAYSGWGADYTRGDNLLLTWDHTQWVATGSSTVGDGVGGPDSSAEFRLIPAGTGTTRLSHFDGKADPRLWTIPVSASTEYTFAVDSQVEAAHTHTVQVIATFFDIDGAVLSTSAGAVEDPDDTGTPIWEQVAHTFTTPADTVFVGIEIEVANTVADEHYFRQAQMVLGATPMLPYRAPRHTRVLLRATTTNHVTTPSFEHPTALAFTAEGAATLALSTDTAKYGTQSLQVTCGLLQERVVATDVPPVSPRSEVFRARFSAKPMGEATGTATARLRWYDEFFVVVAETDGPSVTLDPANWVDANVSGSAPTTAHAVELVLVLDTGGAGSVVHVDGVMLVDYARDVEYFDGSVGEDDTLWEGEANNSRSFYYRKRGLTNGRLTTLMPKFNPRHLSHEFIYGDSAGLAPNASAFSRASGAWRADDWDDSDGLRLLDLSPNANHMTFGDDNTTANDPLLLPYEGTNYMYIGGGNTNYARVPRRPEFDITGDLDITVDVELDNWLPGGTEETFLATRNGTEGGYVLLRSTGDTLRLTWADGTTAFTASSSVVVPTATGRHTVRATLDVDNGAGGCTTTFYFDGVQLGAPIVGAVTSIAPSTTDLFLGANTSGTFPMAGKFYGALVKDGIDGATVLDADCTRRPPADLDDVTLVSTASGAWRAANLTANGLKLTDLTGNGHEARFGADGAQPTSNDPVALGYRGTNYLYLPGVSGTYAEVEHRPEFDLSALDLRCDFEVDLATTNGLLSRWKAGAFAKRVFSLYTTAGATSMALTYSTTGADFFTVSFATPLPVSGVERVQVRVTLTPDNGAGSYVATLFSRAPGLPLGDDTGWAEVQTVTGTAFTLATTDAPLQLGTRNSADLPMTGKMYGALVRDPLTGADVATIDFTQGDRGPVAGLSPLLASATGAWRAADVDADNRALVDLTGNGRPAGFGKDNVGPSSNDPDVLSYDGTRYVYLPDSTEQYVEVANSPALRVTTTISLRTIVTPESLAGYSTLGGWKGSGVDGWLVYLDTVNDYVRLFTYTSVGNDDTPNTVIPVSLSSGSPVGIGFDWDITTGATTLLYSADEGATWVVFGTDTMTNAGGTVGTTSDLTLGRIPYARSTNPFRGRFHSATYTVDGAQVFDLDFSVPDAPAPAVSPLLASATGAWRAADANPEGTRLLDLTGQSRDALFGGDGRSGTSNSPEYLPYDGEQYLYLPGVIGNHASTATTNHISAEGAHPTAARLGLYFGYWSAPVTFDTNVTPFLAGTGGALHVDLDQGTAGKSAYGVGVQPQMSSTMHSDGASVTVGAMVKAPAGLTVRISHRFSDANNILINDGLASGTDFVTTGEWQFISATRTYTGAAFKVLPQVTVANTEDLTTDLWVGGFMTAEGTYTGVFPPSLRFTDDVDLRAKFTLPSTIATRGSVVGTHTTDGKHGAEFQIQTSGGIQFLYGDGTGQIVNATTALLAAGETHTVRVTRDAGTGDITYYTSSDDGVTWDFFDADTSPAGSMGTFLPLGTFAGGRGGTAFPLEGGLYWVALHDGIDGPKVWDVDFTSATQFPDGGASTDGTEALGQPVTIARATTGRKAVLVERPTLLLGTDDYLSIPHHDDFNADASTDLTVVAMFRAFGDTTFDRLAEKGLAGTGAPGWRLHTSSSATTGPYGVVHDGTAQVNSDSPPDVPDGTLTYAAMTLDRTLAQMVIHSTGGTSSAANIPATDFSNTTELRLGSTSTGGSHLDAELYGVAVFVGQVLTAAEIAAVGTELAADTSITAAVGYNSARTTLVSSGTTAYLDRAASGKLLTVVDRPALLAGVDDYLTAPGDWSVDADEDLTIVVAMRAFASSGGYGRLVSTYPLLGYVFDVADAGDVRAWVRDDTANAAAQALSSGTPVIEGGEGHTVALRLLRASDEVEVVLDSVTTTVSAASAAGVLPAPYGLGLLGDPTGGSTFDGEFYGAAVFVGQALTNEQVAAVAAELRNTVTATTPPPPGLTQDRRGVVTSGTYARLVRPDTANKAAVLVDRPLLLLGTDDYLSVPHHADFNLDANGGTVVLVARAHNWNATPAHTLIAKRGTIGDPASVGWSLSRATGGYLAARVTDGTTQVSLGLEPPDDGDIVVFGLTIDSANTLLGIAVDGMTPLAAIDYSAASGTLDNTDMLTIGAGGAATYVVDSLEFFGAAVFEGRLLSGAEMLQVRDELLAEVSQPDFVGLARDHKSIVLPTGQTATFTRTGHSPLTMVDRGSVVLTTADADRLRVPYDPSWDIEAGGDYTVVLVMREWNNNATATMAGTRSGYLATGEPGWVMYSSTGTGGQTRVQMATANSDVEYGIAASGTQTDGEHYVGALIVDTTALTYDAYSTLHGLYSTAPRTILPTDDFRAGNPLGIFGDADGSPSYNGDGQSFFGIALFREVLTPAEIDAVAYQLGYRP